MAHQHVITIPAPGVAGFLPGRHLITAWADGRTTIQWNPQRWGGAWGPPVQVDAETETWTETWTEVNAFFVEGADGLPEEAGA